MPNVADFADNFKIDVDQETNTANFSFGGAEGVSPVWEKYTLTIEEASKYFRIGENKLRRLAEENKDAGWLIMNGNRIQIKRRQFEQVIDKLDAI